MKSKIVYDVAHNGDMQYSSDCCNEILLLFHFSSLLRQDGFPITSLREISVLKKCRHANIVNLLDVVVGKKRDGIFLVFEYCEHDLSSLLTAFKNPFSESEIKCLIIQLLSALEYVHENYIIHRDIKLSNLLYNNQGVLKIADFGLARSYSDPPVLMTRTVVTLWYRSPELLLGDTDYTVGETP